MSLVAIVYCLILLYLQRINTTKSFVSPLNVGTVLFCNSDKGSCWTKEDIALLRSRRILQGVLPPIDLAQVNDEKYVQLLIKYFDRAFDVVRRNGNDLNARIVSRALADTIGGYMKYWALPVSRYGYYAGTVSYESAKNLTDYYENIKEVLATDGYSWRPADETVYRSMNLRITRAPVINEDRNRRLDACRGLNFYRTETSELSIPMPHINWEYKPHMMMVPMQGNSLVALHAPESAYILFNFYMDAQNCLLGEQNLIQKREFDTRFHRWVSTDVLPHLQEDALYAAFGSVFRLLNRSRDWFSPYERKSLVFPESGMLRIFNDNTIACKMNCMIHRLPIFFTALLVLWCGPCILYCYFKNIKCHGFCHGPGGGNSGNGGSLPKPTVTMATEVFPSTTEFRRHRKRSSKRGEQSYPCEVLYSGKKLSEKNYSSPKSSSVNSSKTSSNIKSKTSELLLKVSRANSVHSDFDRELENKISHTISTKIRNSGKILKKLQTAEQPQAKSKNSITQFDSIPNEIEGDHLSETIDYYSSVYTKSDDLISENPCVEMPESLSTIVQEDSRTFTRSTYEIQSEVPSTSISVRSIPNLTTAVKLAPPLTGMTPHPAKENPELAETTMLPSQLAEVTPQLSEVGLQLARMASELADVTPQLPEVRLQLAGTASQLADVIPTPQLSEIRLQLGDLTPQLAGIVREFEDLTPHDSETPESSSADRKDERPSRIPQRRKSTLKQRKYSVPDDT